MQVAVRRASSTDSGSGAVIIDHLLYLPGDYDQNRGRWPLVLFLHGAGERGAEVVDVARAGPPCLVANGYKLPAIVVSPQCPPRHDWQPEILLSLIDEVSMLYRVDARRIYVTGYSMGGIGTWALAAAAPERFAAAAPLCGAGDTSRAEAFRSLPLWVFHGEDDKVVPLKESQEMVDAVRAVGGNVEFTVYPGEGHGICGRTYAREDFWHWLLRQRREDAERQ